MFFLLQKYKTPAGTDPLRRSLTSPDIADRILRQPGPYAFFFNITTVMTRRMGKQIPAKTPA